MKKYILFLMIGFCLVSLLANSAESAKVVKNKYASVEASLSPDAPVTWKPPTTIKEQVVPILPQVVAQQQPSVVPVTPGTQLQVNQQVFQNQPYVVDIPVTGQEIEERKAAFSRGLATVLINVSHNPNIMTLPQVRTMAAEVGSLIQHYSYVSHADAAGKPALFLQVQYDQLAIEQTLGQLKSKVFNNAQASTLVWLTMAYSPISKSLIAESSNDVIVPSLHGNAQKLGLPIVLPAMDLQDKNKISSDQVCALNVDAIKAASMRYGANNILAGCVTRNVLTNKYSGRWILMNGGNSKFLSFEGDSTDEVLNQAMRAVAKEVMKATPATNAGSVSSAVILRITGVEDLTQYAAIVRYLFGLGQITHIDLISLNAPEMQLKISCVGGKQALITMLNAQNRLVADPQDVSVPGNVELNYRLAEAMK